MPKLKKAKRVYKAKLELTFEERVKAELTPVDIDREYDNFLDDSYSFKDVGGPFESMLPSEVLRQMEPSTYNIAFSDWMDSESNGEDARYEEVNGEYYYADEVNDLRIRMEDEAEEAGTIKPKG